MLRKDMMLMEAFQLEGANVEAMANVLAGYGMHCLGCALAHGETIEQAAEVHGVNVDEMLAELQTACNS